MSPSRPPQSPRLSHYRWSEGAIVYQIYPRSYQDSNGDGIGDLPGIISRLKYIKDLGVNTIWLSPFYPSPMADFGYDVADYCAVDPIFGTMNDFDELLTQTHKHGMQLIIDFVPNHTSDEHAWFKASEASREGKYADWYTWRDAHIDEYGEKQPPNNWLDVLNGASAWEWSEIRHQYYLHSFHKRQPDLNWSNYSVRSAMKKAMRFWLDKGIDGFRVDAVYWMSKDPLLTDDDLNPAYRPGIDSPYEALLHNNSCGWPVVYAYLSEMADVLKEETYRDHHRFADRQRFMITEAYPENNHPIASYMSFYVGMDPHVAAPFNFEGLGLPWEAMPWRRFLRRFHQALSQYSPACIASYAFGNHDKPRLASRLGEDAARSAAVMLLTLPGMAFIYNGDELGMVNGKIAQELVQDPSTQNGIGRDPERTPMQWTAEINAGFSVASKTWLPLNSDYKTLNVEEQLADPLSSLSLYRKLCKLRSHSDALRHGNIMLHKLEAAPDVLCYTRTKDRQTYVIFINFSDRPTHFALPLGLHTFIVSSHPTHIFADKLTGSIELLPHEAAIFTA
jgi:alpha-glucosidase